MVANFYPLQAATCGPRWVAPGQGRPRVRGLSPTPSASAARRPRGQDGRRAASHRRGVVQEALRAAAIAAASSGLAAGAISSIAGPGGRRFPFVVMLRERGEDTGPSTTRPCSRPSRPPRRSSACGGIRELRARRMADALEGLPAEPPNGDFRAMPVRGEGLAILKWVTSFPGNPRRGLPTVTGIVLVSDAGTGEPVAMLDARAVTALRTGAAAAVATQELAREDARRSASSAAACTACGSGAAWPTPSTARRLLRPGPRRGRRGAPSSAGRSGTSRRRWPATSSARSPRAPRT